MYFWLELKPHDLQSAFLFLIFGGRVGVLVASRISVLSSIVSIEMIFYTGNIC